MLLLIALISYSPNDPSWSHLSSHTDMVSNLAGRGGAWLSDMLYTFLGASSWWLIAIASHEAWQVWGSRTVPVGGLRMLGYVFLIIATAALTGVWSLSWLAHGIVGQVVGQGLSSLLTAIGAGVFLCIFIAITLTFTLNLQWQNVARLFKKSIPVIEPSEKTPQSTSLDSEDDEKVTAKVLPNTQQLPLPLAGEAQLTTHGHAKVAGRFDEFLDETGFSEAKDYEWMENEANIANNPFKPISSIHLANTKLTKKLDSLLKREVIKPSKTQQPTNNPSTNPTIQAIEQPLEPSLSSNSPVFAGEIVKTEDLSQPTVTQSDQPASKPMFGMNFASFKLHVKKPNLTQTTATTSIDSVDNEQNDTLPPSVEPIDIKNAPTNPAFSMAEVNEFEQNFLTITTQDDTTPLSYDTQEQYDPTVTQFDPAIQTATQSPTHETSAATPHNPHEVINQLLQLQRNTADLQATEPVHLDTMQDNDNSTYVPTVAEILGLRTHSIDQPVSETPAPPSDKAPLAVQERAVEIDELKPIEPTPLDIHDDALFAGKSRAMQTAKYRASLSPLPPLDLLDLPDPDRSPSYSREQLQQLSALLEIKLQEFNVKANVVNAQLGPVVTRFEVELAPGVKASKVTGIARDLARSLSMASVRVVEVIPGKPYIGIEVPNPHRQMVRLIELLKTEDFQDPNGLISMAMGKDIAGRPVITDLAKAPHMLVAGTTGSGKSVLVNSLLLSMLLKYTPDQLRLILIDPKQLELANYNDIPHLLTPVVTDMTEAASALSWCVAEMERRYQLMSLFKVRKLDEFNKKVIASTEQGHPLLDPLWRIHDSVSQDKPPQLKPLPQIVIVADEFADMMMQVGKQAEELITRLAQKSRAAGIHLILATQRPSVDVITGLIKANIPVRAALRVNSKVDSRTILDAGGAEDMLGHGDMLFLAPSQNEPSRVHGAFISDAEVNRICDAWRERGAPDYIDNMFDNFSLTAPSGGDSGGGGIATGDEDALYDEVVAFVLETRKVSASSIQRKFSIGYNRAARIVDAMEEAGLVSGMGKSGKRELLV